MRLLPLSFFSCVSKTILRNNDLKKEPQSCNGHCGLIRKSRKGDKISFLLLQYKRVESKTSTTSLPETCFAASELLMAGDVYDCTEGSGRLFLLFHKRTCNGVTRCVFRAQDPLAEGNRSFPLNFSGIKPSPPSPAAVPAQVSGNFHTDFVGHCISRPGLASQQQCAGSGELPAAAASFYSEAESQCSEGKLLK